MNNISSDNNAQSTGNSNSDSSSSVLPAARTDSSSFEKAKSKFRYMWWGFIISMYFAYDVETFICFDNADHECNQYYERLLHRIRWFVQSGPQEVQTANNKNPFLPTIQFRLLLAYSLSAILSVKFLRNMNNKAFFDGNWIEFLVPVLCHSLLISSVYSLNTAISKKKELQHEYLSLFYYHNIIQILFFCNYFLPIPVRVGKVLLRSHIYYSLLVIACSEYSQFDHNWKPLLNGEVSLKPYSLAILNAILDGIPKELKYFSELFTISTIASTIISYFQKRPSTFQPVKHCALNHSKQLSAEECARIVKQLIKIQPASGQLECAGGIVNITSYSEGLGDEEGHYIPYSAALLYWINELDENKQAQSEVEQMKSTLAAQETSTNETIESAEVVKLQQEKIELVKSAQNKLRALEIEIKATIEQLNNKKEAAAKSDCNLQIPIKLYNTEEESFALLSITGEMIPKHDQNSTTAKCNVYSVHYKNEFCLLQYEPTIENANSSNLVSESIEVTRIVLEPLWPWQTAYRLFRSLLFSSPTPVNASSPSTIQPPAYVVPIGVNSSTLQVSSIHLIPSQQDSSELFNRINIFPPRTVPTTLTHIHEVSTTCTPIINNNNISKSATDQMIELYNSERTNEKLIVKL